MTLVNQGIGIQETRDELSSEPSIQPIYKIKSEILIVEIGPIRSISRLVDNTWIAGHSLNAIVGTTTASGGGQLVVGDTDNTETVLRVININRVYRERFLFTTYQDGVAPNTANWNTTLGRLEMSTDANHMLVKNTVAQSNEVAFADGTISNVTILATETKFGSDTILYFISADGGSSFKEILLNVETSVQTNGTDMRFKVVFAGLGGTDTYIENLRISYG